MARDPNAITTLVDDFTRANTGPPPGPLWTTPLWSGESGLVTVSNQLAASAAGFKADYITSPVAGPTMGVKLQVPTRPAAGALVLLYLATAGLGGNPTAYALRYNRGTDFQVQKYTAGSGAFLAGADDTADLLPAGGWLALCVDAAGVEGFRSSDGSAWTSLGSAADTSLTGPFYGGLEVNSTTARFDNVYLGAPVSAVKPPIVPTMPPRSAP